MAITGFTMQGREDLIARPALNGSLIDREDFIADLDSFNGRLPLLRDNAADAIAPFIIDQRQSDLIKLTRVDIQGNRVS